MRFMSIFSTISTRYQIERLSTSVVIEQSLVFNLSENFAHKVIYSSKLKLRLSSIFEKKIVISDN